MEELEKSVFERLLDEEDNSDIVLYDESGKAVKFEQIAIIPLREEVYAILRPIDKMEGVDENTGLVFLLEESEDGEEILTGIDDKETIDLVYEEYDRLLEE